MMPIIITSGSSEKRFEEAVKIANSYNINRNSPDFISIKPENSIGIEKIRTILPAVNLKPYQSPKKIVIVEDAQKMTVEAQNAFLKTLEEPPQNTIILLLVENPDQLLPTIISRCQVYQTNNNFIDNKFINIDVSEIQKLPTGLRFKLAAEIAATRESAQKWLTDTIFSLHESVIESGEIIIKCQEAKLKLSQNVNPRLVIENLLIDL